MNLSGKTAIITAGASGIGRVIAHRFVEQGAQVCLCDIADDALAAVTRELPSAIVLKADVSKSSDVAALYDAFLARHSRLDILVNNAGISGPTKRVEDITDEEWNETMAVNVSGQFYMVRKAVPLFRQAGGGCVINLSSVAGRLGMPLRAPYSTSKYAVRGLTDVLAVELGEIGVRVNAILPGLVDGPRGQRVMREQAEKRGMTLEEWMPFFLHNISMHTMIDMKEIADVAVFLASDLAPHISGQSISVCGNFESYRGPKTAGH
ncbi:3-oxoacyl-[acyl-carrier-protein] reductase [Mesorhizobium sp. LCM 4577]|uniref:SDR family oxidoreductase n=1 Tax=unclassified Mesorhizobium TaxID=325217 RepID=UPI0008D9E60A|nr:MULTISPECIES: SDR family oxidoreductase [unclassified Mesorhizobium]OHV62664.1 3-oxoacyl-[acyl-carrier-protein] reductase [Mesorhizobium sp. LCM 4577]OHV63286.1 3-oxoacyl-[acyl-carrier-protein] reductase [Mesorhizobium sp. LCM 4576]